MKVFISYSRKDEALADKVVASLEEAGLDAWYDKREIVPGENWAESIARGLKESNAMVVLLTTNSFDSDLVHFDIEYALGDSAYNNRLIPVIVGEPADIPSLKIPWIFKHLRSVRLSNNGRNNEQLKQIASTLKEAA